MTQDLNSFGEIIAHAQCSVDEEKNIYIPCIPHKNNCKKKLVNCVTCHKTASTNIGLPEISKMKIPEPGTTISGFADGKQN
jgi:hypothetical protein